MEAGRIDGNGGNASRLLTGAVTAAAIVLFVSIASAVLGNAIGSRVSDPLAERTLAIALILNVALILIGWRRHHMLATKLTAHALAEARARTIAARDPLTGFLNRRSLAEEGAALLASAQRRRKAIALMIVDIDHFKSVNDMHGHAVGDALLRAVAEEMLAVLPPTALAARLGGDEFACAFAFECDDPDPVARAAERMVSRLAQPLSAEGLRLQVSASVGVARSDADCASIEQLTRRADIAMYAAKRGGRNRYAWFDHGMEQAVRIRTLLETGLREAVPRGEIVPHFEQQIDLANGRLVGFEVLARWRHPTEGPVSPGDFIPIAEEIGVISDLSLSLMQQAFTAARDWHPALTVAVNVSACQLRDPWLAQKIIQTLAETSFPPARLEVEITEAALFDNLALAQSIVASLKEHGIRLVLDDFGTGYSSLAHLRALPFDRIKIDRSFVTSIDRNVESAAIVQAITRLGESLNLPVTAEGIETEAIEERLATLGCHRGQGWRYGQPLSLAETRRLLADRHLLVRATPRTPDATPPLRRAG